MKIAYALLKSIAPGLAVFAVFKIAILIYSPQKVDSKEIEIALNSARPVLLEFHASWCSTCIIQRNVLNSVLERSKFSAINRFTLNYDTEIEWRKKYHVDSQSTLILIKGGNIIARTVGLTGSDELSKFLTKAQ